jgi:plasmid stabilization system protein ParE
VRLVVRDAAEADITEAARWYEQRSPGLGSEFLRAVDVTLAEIVRMPERYPLVRGDARRALLRRFPYAVFFVATADLVSVLACLHARRDPKRWQERSEADR